MTNERAELADDVTDDVDELAARLLEAAHARSLLVSGDLRVCEKDAAALLGISRAYLAELRRRGARSEGLPARLRGRLSHLVFARRAGEIYRRKIGEQRITPATRLTRGAAWR